jgi:ribonuclease D
MAQVLADPSVEIVMHAARQDVALLRRVWSTEVTALFDTQVAAGFAGLRSQAGYDALLNQLLGVKLSKTASYTRWDSRPLSAEQLRYAGEDVLHLLELASELQRRLAASGRLEWAREECRPLERVSDAREIETVFARLPRIGGLDARTRAVAHELVAWREAAAEAADRPASGILNDNALVEVARRRPSTMRELEQLRGVNAGSLRRRGDDLLAAVSRGRDQPGIPPDGERRPPTEEGDAPLIALSEALVRARALEAGIAYELIAARADLQEMVVAHRLAAGEADVRTLRGWRRELVGAELLDLLDGRRALSVDRARRVRTTAATRPGSTN